MSVTMSSLRLSVARLVVVAMVCAAALAAATPTTTTPGTRVGRAQPPSESASEVQPTPGAVNVRAYGAAGTGSGDDTRAFEAAMAVAGMAGAATYPAGPTGSPQGVVYVPPGTYPLLNLTFPSNLRLEVDAGAVLEQAGGRNATSPPGSSSQAPAVVLWDGPGGAPLTNVSLVGVGTASGGIKVLADPVGAGWSIEDSFTLDLDPKATNANNLVAGLMAMNVDGFLVANVFSIQNDFEPSTVPNSNAGWWPSSRKAALTLRSRSDTPIDGSAFYDPHNGTITNWYNVDSPPGFGTTQLESGHVLDLSQIYSQGGTALRLETDNSNLRKFGSELRSIVADDIEGVDCNRAVSFSPHFQMNYDVSVTDVEAISCYQGVVEAVSTNIPKARRGAFLYSTISGVTVRSGSQAQDSDLNGDGLWQIGISDQAFSRDSRASWAVTYGTFSCSGNFQQPSQRIDTATGFVQPLCGASPALTTAAR
jgi:Pectate lyase superfamily protein